MQWFWASNCQECVKICLHLSLQMKIFDQIEKDLWVYENCPTDLFLFIFLWIFWVWTQTILPIFPMLLHLTILQCNIPDFFHSQFFMKNIDWHPIKDKYHWQAVKQGQELWWAISYWIPAQENPWSRSNCWLTTCPPVWQLHSYCKEKISWRQKNRKLPLMKFCQKMSASKMLRFEAKITESCCCWWKDAWKC